MNGERVLLATLVAALVVVTLALFSRDDARGMAACLERHSATTCNHILHR